MPNLRVKRACSDRA